jgi:hypothetical protein
MGMSEGRDVVVEKEFGKGKLRGVEMGREEKAEERGAYTRGDSHKDEVLRSVIQCPLHGQHIES